MIDTLETERLTLRRWRSEDLEPWARINSDPQVMEWLGGCRTPEQCNDVIARFERLFDEGLPSRYAVEVRDTGILAGVVGLQRLTFDAPFSPCVEIGWRIASGLWGKGIATEAARAVCADGFGRLGLEEIVSFTVPHNAASRRVMEKLGMTYNPRDDFDHPNLPAGHALRRHVLYRLRNSFPR